MSQSEGAMPVLRRDVGRGQRPQRAPTNNEQLRLYAMTCGWLTADISFMLARATGRIKVPVPVYLIEHPKGYVLFDTGMHPDCQHDPHSRIGGLADIPRVDFRHGEDIAARLIQLEIEPARIECVANSHLHFDHTGGNALLPNARVVIQQREWDAGRTPELIKANAYDPRDYDLGHPVLQVEGEHDLFGDGSVVMLPTYGHTPGHQSLKLKLASGEIVLAADACYLRRTLEEMHLPKIVHDPAEMLRSLETLRRLCDGGARIFYGHDPEFWREVPQPPLLVV